MRPRTCDPEHHSACLTRTPGRRRPEGRCRVDPDAAPAREPSRPCRGCGQQAGWACSVLDEFDALQAPAVVDLAEHDAPNDAATSDVLPAHLAPVFPAYDN